MSARESREFGVPSWVRGGEGQMPSVPWTFTAEAPLAGMAFSRESGETFLADEQQTLARLDSRGELLSITKLPGVARLLVVSDDGNWGTAVVDDGTVYRFDRGLTFVWEHELSEPCLGVALSPFGNQLAVAMADGQTDLLNERKRRIARFETVRPLAHLQFCTQSPVLFAAADHGLVGCYDLNGGALWEERFWSNVGDLCVTGDGDLVYLAGSTHGIQTLDGDGGTVGAYVLEGTVRQIACSYEPGRLIASTVERQVSWINSDGEMLWTAEAPDDIVELACDAFGNFAVCGQADGTVCRLDWGGY
jgi:hypothetical protein